MKPDLTKLSKTFALILRHDPGRFSLELDPEGWADLGELLEALNRERMFPHPVTQEDALRMIAEAGGGRYEHLDGSVRALYGHSVEGKISHEPVAPPAELFHGTTPAAAETILREGLKPMNRQYVHLSVDLPTAQRVARRRTSTPVILIVDAIGAHAQGVRFYAGSPTIFQADPVPAGFIRRQ